MVRLHRPLSQVQPQVSIRGFVPVSSELLDVELRVENMRVSMQVSYGGS